MFNWFKKEKFLEGKLLDAPKNIRDLEYDVRRLQNQINNLEGLAKDNNKEIDKLRRIINFGDRDYPRYRLDMPYNDELAANEVRYLNHKYFPRIVYIYVDMKEYAVELKEIGSKVVNEETVELTFDGDLAELTLETVHEGYDIYHRFIIEYKNGHYVHTEVKMPKDDEEKPVCP